MSERRLVIDSDGPRVETEYGTAWFNQAPVVQEFFTHPDRIFISRLRYLDPEAK